MSRKKKEKEEPKTNIDDILSGIEKKYGKGAIIQFNKNYTQDTKSISTGSISLDMALGIGGVPKGRVIEILGAESAGKTTLALSIVKQCQETGGNCVYIDAEHAFDPDYATKIGIDINKLHISQPDYGEMALDIAQSFVESGKIDLIVIDSVASLTPKAELEGEMEDANIGLQARLMSKALRKLTGSISKNNTCVIFINQIRMKIGVMFGNPETTPGGLALKFYASVRIDLRRKGLIKDSNGSPVASEIRAKVIKNKVAPPYRQAEFAIYYDEGLSTSMDILQMGLSHGIIKKAGAWFSYNDEKIGQGQDNARQYLKDNPKILKAIREEILKLLGRK
ncbi:MAG: recombinase RecA [Promethearchaeota archaeon]